MSYTYKTKDLGEAAALICKSANLFRLDKEQNFFWFVFDDRKLCEKLSNDYWFGELIVNARKFKEILDSLKNRLFNYQQSSQKGGTSHEQ